MTDHEFIESITSVCKALKDAQNLAETYRSAWQSQKDMCDQLSTDVTRLENDRDRLKEQLEKKESYVPYDEGDCIPYRPDDSDDYIEDGGARNAH